MLDGPVRDTASSVKHPLLGDRARGTRVQAAPAGPAAVTGEGQLRRELQAGENSSNKRERPALGVDEHGILPNPSQTGALGEFALGHGSGVDVRSPDRTGRSQRNEIGRQRRQGCPQRCMIVTASCVFGDLPTTRRWRAIRCEVVFGDHQSPTGSRGDLGGFLASGRLTVHVGHPRGHPLIQPAVKRRGVSAWCQVGDAGRVEPQCERSRLGEAGRALRRHNRSMRRRQVANRTTSSMGGTASGSPYAVYMRQRT